MAKTYETIGWKDGEVGNTPINATNLNHMDNAIKSLYDEGASSKDIFIGPESEAPEDAKLLIDSNSMATPTNLIVSSLDNNEEDKAPSVKAIKENLFPIGKVEIFYDNEDHSNHLGFTWERTMIGRVPVGIDSNDSEFNEIGKIGGEKTHTLVTNELPKIDGGMFYHSTGTSQWSLTSATGGGVQELASNTDQPHNNLQPYQVVAFWKRIG